MQLAADYLDYVNRTVDLLMLDDARADGDTRLTQTLVQTDQSGALITGIEMLVQRFLLELLTEQGSLQYLPTRGCSFMLDARHGMWRTPGDVFASFSAAMLDVKNNLIGDESDSDPDDERFASATLDSVAINQDRVTMSISLSSVAGVSRQVVYPLRIT